MNAVFIFSKIGFIIANNLFKGFSISILFYLLAIAVLLFLSAIMSASEVAFFSLKPADLSDQENKSKLINLKLVIRLLDRPKHLLATILIGNNAVNIAIVVISSFLIIESFDFSEYLILGFVIQVIIVTYLILQIGEILPKVYSAQNPLKFANRIAPFMIFLSKLFYPVASLLVLATSIIDRRVSKKSYSLSMNELSHALDITEIDKSQEEERKILKRIVKFGNIDVKEIMRPRTDVIACESGISFSELMKLVIESGYSRIPIYKNSFDTIIGILHTKDLLPVLNTNECDNWESLIRTPFFVPESKKINDLLEEFQEKKIHLAVIVDEYGGTSGIVTLEDIIEEIVGEINDEFDGEEIIYSRLDDNSFVFEAKTSLVDFCKVLAIDPASLYDFKGESETLAGFILELTGRIPDKNEIIKFKNFSFKIESVDKRRIKRVKVTSEQTNLEEL